MRAPRLAVSERFRGAAALALLAGHHELRCPGPTLRGVRGPLGRSGDRTLARVPAGVGVDCAPCASTVSGVKIRLRSWVTAFATATLLTSQVAMASTAGASTMPVGFGSGAGATSGVPVGVIGSGSDLAASAYTLAQVDPMTSAMSMGEIGLQLTGDYAVTSDLAATDLAAINLAETARLARLAEEAKRAAAARGAGGQTLRPGSVPRKYEALILEAIAQHCPQLSPGLLAAQLEAESNFNPSARSPVGAQGIAQFMPGTWAAYGVDGNGDGRKDPFDPADAIPAAARYNCVIRDQVRKVPGDADSNMLAAYNAGPGAVLKYRGIPPYAETQGYVSKILSRAGHFTVYDDADAGSSGGPGGCPTSAPAGTLRENANRYGIHRICTDSVAQARTPEAARAIKFALRNLGAPYSQPNRMGKFSFDCSSLVMRAYESGGAKVISGGWAPNTYYIETVRWAKPIAFGDRRPGDLVYPFPGHIAMSLANGLKVHTNRPGDVSHVNNMYSSAYRTVRIDTSLL